MQWAESYYKHIFKLLLLFQKQIGNNIKSILKTLSLKQIWVRGLFYLFKAYQ